MDYKTYKTEDFLFDESFRQWTAGTSPEATAFWEQWVVQNPDRVYVVRQAQELIRELDDQYRDDATDARLTSELHRLVKNAAARRDAESDAPVIPLTQRISLWRWTAAAAVLVMVGFGIWNYGTFNQQVVSASYTHLTKSAKIPLQEKVNTCDHVVNILLPDGSAVTLRPKSRLSYPAQFSATNRVVYLNGEAFFDVVKNPAKPFLIYANQMVTKVLGTSFLVRAFETEKNVTVTVRTGRVSVYKQQDFENAQQSGTRQVQGVILTPNQQMIYNLVDNQLMKALVEKPKAIMPEAISTEQVFEDSPVGKVFSTIERTYGVKLIYSEEDLSACLVNLSFTSESLLERLDVVCQTIGASYEVVDGQVVINSKGCQ